MRYLKIRISITIIFFSIYFSGCSSVELVKSTQFSITRQTPITVDCGNDPLSITGLIEAELMKLGFNLVPFDQAQRVVELRKQSITSGEAVAEKSQLKGVTYSPTAVIMRVNYSYVKSSLGDGIPSMSIRLLDLEENRILAIISFEKNGDRYNTTFVIDRIAQKFKELIE